MDYLTRLARHPESERFYRPLKRHEISMPVVSTGICFLTPVFQLLRDVSFGELLFQKQKNAEKLPTLFVKIEIRSEGYRLGGQ